MDAIHSDISPNNVFLGDVEGPSPVVKVGDLDNMLREGFIKPQIQSLECRAPEVWRGLGCWPSSDVWSVGVTLLHWLSPHLIFGASDNVLDGCVDPWCIAKITRLIRPFGPHAKPELEMNFRIAETIAYGMYPDEHTQVETFFIKTGTLRDELEKIPGPKLHDKLIDFIEHLLILNPDKRPTAEQALNHPYLQGLVQCAEGCGP